MRTWLVLAVLGVGCGRTPGTAPEGGGAAAPEAAAEAVEVDRKDVEPPVDEGTPPVEHEPDAPGEPDPVVEEPEVLAAAPSESTSIGSPTSGRLEGSVPLPVRAPGLMFLPSKDPDSRYGTVELVQGLVRAAARMEDASSGAPVTVGDLARAAGGDIAGHASHRSGRDVDVLFHLLHDDGRPFLPSKFIPLDPQGRGTDYGDLSDPSDDVPVHLDVPRTWSFVAALLADEQAAVQKILVVEHIRTMLLEQAERVGAPEAIVRRFSEVTCQPRFPHDDHMHIRVFCSAEDIEAGCEDTRPIFGWRKRALKASGVTPVLAGSTPKSSEPKPTPKAKPKLKTIEQARAEAGPMHQDVVDFLDRREAWARKPHPGRRYCR